MNSAIVGAGGFIGRCLGNHLIDEGHAVLGLDAVAGEAVAGDAVDGVRFPLERCDVLADEIVLPGDLDVVYYLAQSPHYREFPRRADHLFAVNVTGALKTAEAARAAGARLLCYASTGTVYAPGFAPMTEDRKVRRDHGYALSKICAEEALAALVLAGDELCVLCPRLFGVFGPGQSGMLVSALAGRVRDGRAVTLERNPEDPADEGGLRVSLTFVGDLARCLTDLVEPACRGERFAVLNVASDEAVSIRDLACGIGAELGIEPRFEIVDRSRESDYIADVTRLRSLIDPAFTPLHAALSKTLPSHV